MSVFEQLLATYLKILACWTCMGQVASRVQATVMSWYSDQLVSETSVCSDPSANTGVARCSSQSVITVVAVAQGKEITDDKMGQKSSIQKKKMLQEIKFGPHYFEVLACVGQGGFSKVFQCRKKGTDDIFAMKVITKTRLMNKKYVKAERDILTKVLHPFVVKLHYSFQTRTRLYLLFDFINGGGLFFHLNRQQMFSEETARICIAEIVCAVAHLHENGIIHRDVKPENILLDSEGHVKLTDFGLAKEVDDSTKSKSFCGTLEYMAPEIILEEGHGKPADWWSVGILLHEMLTGKPPFIHPSPNRLLLQQIIVGTEVHLPTHFTSEAITLFDGLLQKDPRKRLGSGPGGADEIKHHEWFKDINWRKVVARELQPKFRPTVNGINCIANFDESLTEMPLQDVLQDSPALTLEVQDTIPCLCFPFQRKKKGEATIYFPGFTYIGPEP